MVETEKGIYCKKCKDFYPEDHFNKFKYNTVRGIPYTCKYIKKKGGKYESKNKYKIDSYEYSRDMALRRMYGTSLEEFNNLLSSQNNCCKICNKVKNRIFNEIKSTNYFNKSISTSKKNRI